MIDRIALFVCLALPSLGIVEKYLGRIWLLPYLLFVAVGVWGIGRISDSFPPRNSKLPLILLFIGVIIAFVVVNPIANNQEWVGGSDRDEALTIGVQQLLQGNYPYYVKTYFDNPITPMPGALLLATPFVLLGNSAYQTIFWLAIYLGMVRRKLPTERSTALLFGAIILLSPVAIYDIVVGNDLTANALYVLVGCLWLIEKKSLKSAVFLGIALASRANFVLFLPLVWGMLVTQIGRTKATRLILLVVVVGVGITLPFYLYDPAGFSPLHTATELTIFNKVAPYAHLWIPGVTALVAVLFGLLPMHTTTQFLRRVTWVSALPILIGFAILLIFQAKNYLFLSNGVFFLYYGVWSFWTEQTVVDR